MNYVEFVALAGLSHFKADKIIENIIIESKYQVDTHYHPVNFPAIV